MLRSLMAGVRALIRPSERNAEIEEELRSFFAASVEDKLLRGVNRENAEREARVEACPRRKGPRPDSCRQPTEQDCNEGDGKSRGPVVHAKDRIRDRDHPVLQRGLFEILDAIQMRGYPIARHQHVACDLRLCGIHVIHESGRPEHAAEEDYRGHQNDA